MYICVCCAQCVLYDIASYCICITCCCIICIHEYCACILYYTYSACLCINLCRYKVLCTFTPYYTIHVYVFTILYAHTGAGQFLLYSARHLSQAPTRQLLRYYYRRDEKRGRGHNSGGCGTCFSTWFRYVLGHYFTCNSTMWLIVYKYNLYILYTMSSVHTKWVS